jgi:hypothetical protein
MISPESWTAAPPPLPTSWLARARVLAAGVRSEACLAGVLSLAHAADMSAKAPHMVQAALRHCVFPGFLSRSFQESEATKLSANETHRREDPANRKRKFYKQIWWNFLFIYG